MSSPAYRKKAASSPTVVQEVATDAAPVTADEVPETENLGLPLIPDDADAWGDDYRRAMATIDANPGVRAFAVGQRPANPFGGQVILEQGDKPVLLAYDSTAQEWKTTDAPTPSGGYHHVQTVPSAVWTVIHNLGFTPAGFQVVAENGSRHIPDIGSNTGQATVLIFNEPISGHVDVS